jgi:hypothetical protein
LGNISILGQTMTADRLGNSNLAPAIAQTLLARGNIAKGE